MDKDGPGDSDPGRTKVAVVGGGLVGALNCSYLAKRGFNVHLYEYRDDIRLLEHVSGRSINLAMSFRGRCALRHIGLEEEIIEKHGIPMYARMIHSKDGTKKLIPYGKKNQCIYSISRRHLNEVLLTAAESYSNVTFHFSHKLLHADLDTGEMVFRNVATREEVRDSADLIMGTDGAYSAVRKQMAKRPQFNYSQLYIPHGYLELCMPASEKGDFRMEPNYLHIWPCGSFMMIALPNQDSSFTVTLFMPFDIFRSLDTPSKLLAFFEDNFPDSLPHLGKQKLVQDYFAAKPSQLVTVKCRPYHVRGCALILGDAAHAMVPFFGQGMNCGMEDCLLLDEMLVKNGYDLEKTLAMFSEYRNPDAEAICDLALYNYIEMRDLVNHFSFRLRKKLDLILYGLMPRLWVPLYTSVTFSRMRYHLCVKNRQWQDKVLRYVLAAGGVSLALVTYFLATTWKKNMLNMLQPTEPLITFLTSKVKLPSIIADSHSV